MDMLRNKIWLRCFLAGACTTVGTWILNEDIISVFSATLPLERDILYILGGILPYALIAFLSRKRPSALRVAPLSVGSCIAALLGSVLFLTASASGNNALLCVAFFLCFIGRPWSCVALMLSLCELEKPRDIALCISAFTAAGILLRWMTSFAPSEARVLALALTTCIVIPLLYSHVKENELQAAHSGHPRDLALSQPHAFVSPYNMAFFGILALELVFGFALALNCVSGVPVDTFPTGFLALALGAWIFFSPRERGREDILFSVAILLVVGGLLVAIVSILIPLGIASNIILASGSMIFTLLQYLVVTAMGLRNKLDAIYIIAFAQVFNSVGTLVGASTGHGVNALAEADGSIAIACMALMLFCFVTFCVIWLRRYSFDALIYGIEEVKPLVTPAESETTTQDIEQLSALLAEERGLTKRESEILIMLARGRNGKFIEDYFTVSYNTVKTHVKHIYMKLDVHSQQELINLVEARASSNKDA